MKLSDLISGPDGKASHTKLWNNAGAATMTAIVWHQHLGEWWEMRGGSWGGRFGDANHYSLEHEGMK